MMNLLLRRFAYRHRAPRQDVASVFIRMIYVKADCIPELGRDLPFVNQARILAFQ